MKPISILSALVLTAFIAVSTATGAHAFLGMFGKYQQVTPENGTVAIALTEVNDGKAHYYSMNAGDRDIRFFVIKSQDDVLRAAFDACDVCYREGKGYDQDGESMICNNCGQRFHSSRINEVKGGCNPAPLTRTIKGDKLIITQADIMTGAGYF
ncbi:DUF2318 domain-containing protein [Desulfovibrio ferrophilus]|uniref:Membrane iron-sulfur containing protein FtrD-like domain-containing protein n=1 Tax=Desulfovibrio ferrophilus TaxID=241368 RepID=A0A2Z6AUA8_9BACT|nr:DUF2318 domain-containing protein [Desulfovibrio ferrophilus]BBD06800.1 uncharacterized protein DFE_0074 [Desulfovibrio ferrophilus]